MIRKVLLTIGALGWTSIACAVPIPDTLPWLTQDDGGFVNFNSESCCISYDAATDNLLAFSSGQMSWLDDRADNGSSASFDGTWLLEAKIDEQFQITDPGTVALFGDIGSGLELLIGGRVTRIGFEKNFTEFDQPSAFYGVFFMQIVFEITRGNDVITSQFGQSASFLTGHRIGDSGFFLPGARTDSPFAQDFRCGENAFRCRLEEGSYGINALAKIPEPGTFALLSIALTATGLFRRRKRLKHKQGSMKAVQF